MVLLARIAHRLNNVAFGRSWHRSGIRADHPERLLRREFIRSADLRGPPSRYPLEFGGPKRSALQVPLERGAS